MIGTAGTCATSRIAISPIRAWMSGTPSGRTVTEQPQTRRGRSIISAAAVCLLLFAVGRWTGLLSGSVPATIHTAALPSRELAPREVALTRAPTLVNPVADGTANMPAATIELPPALARSRARVVHPRAEDE